MTSAGKVFILFGLIFIIVGLAIWLLGKAGFRGLPGDLRFTGEHVNVSIPIVTCMVASIILTILINLAIWIIGRWT